MQYIGKLDKEKLKEYKDKIVTDYVIITKERIERINIRHPGDYEKYIEYIPNIVNNPDYILEDINNKDTLLFLKTIKEKQKNIEVVVKLQTHKQDKDKTNSILTFFHARKRTYNSAIKNNLWKTRQKWIKML